MRLSLKRIAALLVLQCITTILPAGVPLCKAPVIISQDISFGAFSDGKKVIVCWSTVNERSFDYFTIERSKDGVNFVTAVMIKGAGKITTLMDYTDIDYSPFSGISYYRLKQTDYSGESFYSETVIVNYQVTKDGSIVPCTNKIPDEEELKEVENKTVLVVLKDGKGQEYISKIHLASDNQNLYGTDVKNALGKGTYLVIASSYNRLCSQKLVIR